MSSERLSKLQKQILEYLKYWYKSKPIQGFNFSIRPYEDVLFAMAKDNNQLIKQATVRHSLPGGYGKEIAVLNFGEEKWMPTPKFRVTFSKSLSNLVQKGLVTKKRHTTLEGSEMTTDVILTDKGKEILKRNI